MRWDPTYHHQIPSSRHPGNSACLTLTDDWDTIHQVEALIGANAMMMLSLSHDSGSVIINPDGFNLCATGSNKVENQCNKLPNL